MTPPLNLGWMSCLAGEQPQAAGLALSPEVSSPPSRAAAKLVQLKQSGSCAGWNKRGAWAILARLRINPARGRGPERMFGVFCRCFLGFNNILSCLLLLQGGPKNRLHQVTHLTPSPSFACSSVCAIQNTDVPQLEKPSLDLLWFLAEVRRKEKWYLSGGETLNDSVVGILIYRLDSGSPLLWTPQDFAEHTKKSNYIIFLISAPDTKGLNTCVCVCLCVWNPTA